MALKFLKDNLKHLEPIDLAIIYNALSPYFPRQEEIKGRDMTLEELEEAMSKFEEVNSRKDWFSLSEEDKERWDNNQDLFNEVTEVLVDPFLEYDHEIEEKFESLVTKLEKYLKKNNLNSMVLGVSGGIDSTLASVICWEVYKRTNIHLYGISMPLRNTEEEKESAEVTGKAWYNDMRNAFWIFPIEGIYEQFQLDLQMFGEGYNSRDQKHVGEDAEDTNLRIGKSSKIANGNIMARVRMTLLYHTAGIHKGITISTGNKSENELGFFTIHGDEPMDYFLLDSLWKTEVYRMTEWYLNSHKETLTENQIRSLEMALQINPTDGNGVSDTDLHQILGEDLAEKVNGREGYYIVDRILVNTLGEAANDISDLPEEIINRVKSRNSSSQFKRDLFMQRNG